MLWPGRATRSPNAPHHCPARPATRIRLASHRLTKYPHLPLTADSRVSQFEAAGLVSDAGGRCQRIGVGADVAGGVRRAGAGQAHRDRRGRAAFRRRGAPCPPGAPRWQDGAGQRRSPGRPSSAARAQGPSRRQPRGRRLRVSRCCSVPGRTFTATWTANRDAWQRTVTRVHGTLNPACRVRRGGHGHGRRQHTIPARLLAGLHRGDRSWLRAAYW